MKLVHTLLLALFGAILIPTTVFGSLLCKEKQNYSRCDYNISINEQSESVPVFVYSSSKINNQKPVEYILFLHGRGYARSIGAKDSMLEHLKLNDFFESFENSNFVFLSPQDIFFHQDSQSIGQDYWIGKEGRDWTKFLGQTMQDFAIEVSQDLQIQGELKTVIGISMGAHGALILGQNYSSTFQNVIALSPIFRPTLEEIPANDKDVFLKMGLSGLEELNFGTKLIQGSAILTERTYITISKTDFGLDRENFPNGTESWNRLLEIKGDHHHIKILSDERGHSIGLWQDQFRASLAWLFN